MKNALLTTSILSLSLFAAACGGDTPEPTSETASAPPATETPAPDEMGSMTLEEIVTADWRSEGNIARNEFRNPVETLEFFDIEPDDSVLEVWPGGGWYTEILAPYLAEEGRYIAAGPDPAASDYAQRSYDSFSERFLSAPEMYGEIEFVPLSRDTGPLLAEGDCVDAVLTFRNIHNWMAGQYADKMFSDMYDALCEGGTLGVVEHRLNSADMQDPSASNGYVHEDYAVQLAEAAGFVLVESSEINANPADTKDHPGGVWNLPPNLRTTDANREEIEGYDASVFEAIGESDRMTLMFRKPTAEEIAAAEAEAAEEETEE
ncbi:hypothetical protein [Ponticaulis sp.]|uniref:class I SAM-dependent methyltransferase n=1 Tax=Ponticaulis sp. TaxID=2020902 RepID=UPI000B683C12|nr:hypothetical protein [Ponticaulis sp.]MAI89314.1 hypothetical protein [Ponticaulis sp.]OUY01331.1 MAG: hypothetical protein CBB65_02365 [Hyphomonadaceae bacterium TMED5]